MYKIVEPFYEVTDCMRKKENFFTEMSREDHGFLCGIMKELKPHKILEIGVAEGGTTAVIMQTCMQLGLNSEVISIDFNEKLYYDKSQKTGYILDNMNMSLNNHRFLLGNTVAGFVEEIGNAIDLVVIDTTHCLPGEILDFLVLYPHLSSEATVVLHDLNVNYVRAMTSIHDIDKYFAGYSDYDVANAKDVILNNSKESVATKLLFTVVNGDKYMNFKKNIPDIGAFQINDDTKNSIADIFLILSCTWAYMLEPVVLSKYRELFAEYYNAECLALFDAAVFANVEMKKRFDSIRKCD